MSEDYTSKTIISTYKSILHIGGDKVIYDGTGSIVTFPSSSFSVTSSYALSSKYTTDSASISTKIDNKQDIITSGVNIKTINSQSILGSGDITISTGSLVNTSSFLLFSSSVNSSILTLTSASASLQRYNTDSGSFNSNISNRLLTSIYNIDSSSLSTRITNTESTSSAYILTSASLQRYNVDSGSFNTNIGSRLLTSTYTTYSSSVSSSLTTKIGDSYETVSKNLRDYPKSLTYSGTTLLQVTHSLDDGSYIYKIFVYSGSYITTASLIGNLPVGIKTNKILSYNSSGSVVGINYI